MLADAGMDVGGEDENRASSTGAPDSESGPNPAANPAPDSPSLSVQLASPRDPSGKHPEWEPSFDEECGLAQSPIADMPQHDEMTWD